jgi:hypothetical protein
LASALLSLFVLGILFILLPRKRGKPPRWALFIPLAAVALGVSAWAFAFVNTCADLGKPVLVEDYAREVTTGADADALIREYLAAQYSVLRARNASGFDEAVGKSMAQLRFENGAYVVPFFLGYTYRLQPDGKLYRISAGD